MSSSGGVDLTANGIAHQTAECVCGAGVAVCSGEAVSQASVKTNLMMNGPETDPHFHRQEIVEQDGDSAAGVSVRKCNDHFSCPVAEKMNQLGEKSKAQANSILSSKEDNIGKKNKLTTNDKMCLREGGTRKDFRLARPGSKVSENADDKEINVDTSSKISKLKSNMANTSEAANVNARFDGLTNGCCDYHVQGEMSNMSEQGKDVSVSGAEEQSKIENTESYTATNRQSLDKLISNCTDTTISEPLSDLTQMVENVCLDGQSSQDVKFASSTEKLKSETAQGSPCEQGATCSDLLGGIDQPFGVIGPAGGGADLEDADLEELPSSLSDFVLGCPSSQYTVPPCPLSDSDINTIHIRSQTGSSEHPVTLVPYKSEVQMPDIMRLITKDLSEPYSIYTYRYFIHNWPQLCFLAMHQDKCVGAIVCKLDVHKKMARRGYIAMLAVDENYRKLQIGSSLVKKAIRAMVRGECDEVVLETEITNKPALKLYENLGFLRDKRLFRYYLNGVDALRLKLWLR